MIFPVKILNPNGSTRRIITTKSLEKRSDAIIRAGHSYSPDDPIREYKCAQCGKRDWTKQKAKKYCGQKCKDKNKTKKGTQL